MTDPPVREDGKCARGGCDKDRKIPPKKQRHVDVAIYEREPFCSRTCCEMFHGTYRKGRGSSGTDFSRRKPKMFWKEVAA